MKHIDPKKLVDIAAELVRLADRVETEGVRMEVEHRREGLQLVERARLALLGFEPGYVETYNAPRPEPRPDSDPLGRHVHE